jgi:hypothetical protein
VLSKNGCPYAVIISIIAGLTYPIPLFGILSSTCIGGVLAFVPESDLGTGLQVALIVLVVNTVIDRTLLPKLMSNAIGVSPLFVIFAAAAGGEFVGGVWGMFKAIFVWFHGEFLTDPEARLDHLHSGAPHHRTHPPRLPTESDSRIVAPAERRLDSDVLVSSLDEPSTAGVSA